MRQVADEEEDFSMIPGKHDIKIKKGDTFRLFFRARAKNPDESPGAYFDFTGMFPKAQLKSDTGTLLATFEATLGDQVTYPGSVLIRLGPVTSASLTATTTAKYDVQVSSVNPSVITDADDNDTYLEGGASIIADVTDNT